MGNDTIKTRINRLRCDMTEVRGHIDDMLGRMDKFVDLANQTADEADSLAKSLSRHPGGGWNPFRGVGGPLTIAGLAIAGLAIFSPQTLDNLWRRVQSYLEASMPTEAGTRPNRPTPPR